ncbi:hypothetical protein BDBG_16886 [Blastomyces gilchristii SLH14081]|uniref:Uncharacterized protein n=1 Tax=Blastomyces gilchristii (strain SLH14081) TaxID=559298 RepID=A0A179UKM9_BLAGS|nr:uncharacterized protein BDBG_16886 [Blastomyces gilchristii SLH14081]OAT07707.1 hypothetical protein BDBG_16886 [Blastomyces gilchristii SLH14081]
MTGSQFTSYHGCQGPSNNSLVSSITLFVITFASALISNLKPLVRSPGVKRALYQGFLDFTNRFQGRDSPYGREFGLGTKGLLIQFHMRLARQQGDGRNYNPPHVARAPCNHQSFSRAKIRREKRIGREVVVLMIKMHGDRFGNKAGLLQRSEIRRKMVGWMTVARDGGFISSWYEK